MKMKTKPFYNVHHFTRRGRSLKAGPALIATTDSRSKWVGTFLQYAQNTLWDSESLIVAAFPSHYLTITPYPPKISFLNIITCWTIPKLPLLPMRQETSRLHRDPGRGRGLGGTKSLRQADENPQLNQHRNVLFSLRGAPSRKAEIMAICQAKRSAQTLWNCKNNITNSSQSPIPETPTWATSTRPLCSPWTPLLLNIPHSLPTHHSRRRDNFFSLDSHEVLVRKGKINIQEKENIKFAKSLT